jgi:hypothetical protein
MHSSAAFTHTELDLLPVLEELRRGEPLFHQGTMVSAKEDDTVPPES